MDFKILDQLHQWRAQNLPVTNTPQGAEIMIWLLEHANPEAKLRELYRASVYSEPTIRGRLSEFVSAGLITVTLDEVDSRKHIIRLTEKLDMLIREYAVLVDLVAQSLGQPSAGEASTASK